MRAIIRLAMNVALILDYIALGLLVFFGFGERGTGLFRAPDFWIVFMAIGVAALALQYALVKFD